MGSKTILVDREYVKALEIEEQLHFVFSILHSAGIPEEKLEPCFNNDFSVENKIALRKLCEKEQISIVDANGSLKIYIQDNGKDVLIAEWYIPIHTLRIDKDLSERSKKMFIEIKFKWWTIFEEEVDNDTKR